MPRDIHRPAEASIGGWQKAVSQAYFPLETEARGNGPFNGQLEAWPLGPLAATRIACDPVLYRRKAAHLCDARDDAILISIPTAARVHFTQNDRDTICPPGGFVIERSDSPYEYWHAEPDVQWVVKVPRDGVQARIGIEDLPKRVVVMPARRRLTGPVARSPPSSRASPPRGCLPPT